MENNKWVRNCPNCNQELSYSRKSILVEAVKLNRVCNSCKQIGSKNPFYGKRHTEEHKKYIGSIQNTEKYIAGRQIARQKLKNNPKSDSHRQNLSKSLIGKFAGDKNPMFGKTHNTEVRTKIRNKNIEWHYRNRQTEEYKLWASKKDEYALYRLRVFELTRNADLRKLSNYSKKNTYHKYEIDHIYPIVSGFRNGIPAELIGNIENLRIIPRKENRSKSGKIFEQIIPEKIKKYLENETKNNSN